MPPKPVEVPEILEERKQAQRVLDLYGHHRVRYEDWRNQNEQVLQVLRHEWEMVWPDGERNTNQLSFIPNLPRLAADDRTNVAASLTPSVICHPTKPGDKARAQSDKRERIFFDWLDRSGVFPTKAEQWSQDAMATGLSVCKVWMDLDLPRSQRYPTFSELSPELCLPDPVFSRGPFVDSMIVTYEEKIRTVEKNYKKDLGGWKRDSSMNPNTTRVIEYWDDEVFMAVAQQQRQYSNAGNPKYEVLANFRHDLGKCPIVIGTKVSANRMYEGDFFGSLGIMNYWNRLMTLVLDDAANRVYDSPIVWNVQNYGDYGPGVAYDAEGPDAKVEYPNRGNQAFSNLQVLNSLGGFARAAVLMPPSRSGDPNESIISAAGISAAQSQFSEAVKSIQRSVLSPMLAAGLEVGALIDQKFADREKAIGASGGSYTEMYLPSKDIGEYRKASISYGVHAGMDPVTTNVMVLQQKGAGILDRRTAMEQSPFVEDPQRTEKRLIKEQLQDAQLAGIYAQASNGQLPPDAIARIEDMLDKDEVSLTQAIAAVVPTAPLAAPEQTAPSVQTPEAPGLAGAAEGQQPQQLPDLNTLLGAA